MTETRSALSTPSTRTAASIPRVNDLEWNTKTIYAAVAGPAKKVLSSGSGGAVNTDPTASHDTWLTHIPPWWRDAELVYHPCIEEAFVLNGAVQLGDRYYGPGCYVYRPPGILHGPAFIPSDIGATLFQRFNSEGGILRYEGTEFPHVDSQPVTDDHVTWPVPWVEWVDSETIPWQPVDDGPWSGTAARWLSRNRETGGGTVLVDIPAGWAGEGTRGRGTSQEFVVHGPMTIGGMVFERWGYSCRAPGEAAGAYTTSGPARLICVWDEDEFA